MVKETGIDENDSSESLCIVISAQSESKSIGTIPALMNTGKFFWRSEFLLLSPLMMCFSISATGFASGGHHSVMCAVSAWMGASFVSNSVLISGVWHAGVSVALASAVSVWCRRSICGGAAKKLCSVMSVLDVRVRGTTNRKCLWSLSVCVSAKICAHSSSAPSALAKRVTMRRSSVMALVLNI